jgi:ribosome recycling factor
VIDELLLDVMEKMGKAAAHLQEQFSGIRTGRATPALVEKIRVEYYGSEVPLQQLAGFSVPEARMLVISPFDKSAIKAIEKALQSADLGMSPANDGVVIRLLFPPLTQERRKDLVKSVKAKAEDSRVAVRNVRRSARGELEKAEKANEINKDDLERAEKELDKITQEHIAEIDRLVVHKEAELMEV